MSNIYLDRIVSFYEKYQKVIRSSFFVLFSLFVILLIFYLNVKTPLFADDLYYTFIFHSPNKITGIMDIFRSQYEQYMTWGGRSVVHVIAQYLLYLPPIVADIANSIAFLLLLTLIYLHINYKKPFSISLFVGIFLLVWFMMPFADTILWITGSANYLWGGILILAFLFVYRHYNGKRRDKNGVLYLFKSVLMFICGIICGWTNENTGAAMLLMIVLFMVYYRKNKWGIPLWAITGLVGALIGYLVMILAPGNFIRARETHTDLFLIIYRFFRYTQAYLNFLGILALAIFILAFYAIKQKVNNFKDITIISFIYFIGGIAAVYVMVLSPSFPQRAWFGIIVFTIISLGILVTNLQNVFLRYLKYGAITLGLLIFSFNSFDINKEINMVDNIVKERDAFIRKSIAEGKKKVILSPYHVSSKYIMADPIYASPLLTIYYGIEIEYEE